MVENILKIISRSPHVAIASLMPVLALIICLFKRPAWDKTLKIIFFFLIFVIVTDIPLWITAGMKMSNIFYGRILDTATFIFISFIYYKEGTVNSIGKLAYFFYAIILIHFLLQITKVIDPGTFLWINRIAIFSIVICYLFALMADPKIKDIVLHPFFWFNAGVMVYSSGSLLVTLFYRFTLSPESDKELYFKYFYLINHITVILFYIFVAFSFLIVKKNTPPDE